MIAFDDCQLVIEWMKGERWECVGGGGRAVCVTWLLDVSGRADIVGFMEIGPEEQLNTLH